MVFGKHINRYYLRYAHMLLLGLAALVMVDYLQLKIPEIYRLVINGMNTGYALIDGVETPLPWRCCWTPSVCPWWGSSWPSSWAALAGG